MTKILKRLGSLAMALLMVVSLLPLNVFAETAAAEGDIATVDTTVTWTEVDTLDELKTALAAGGHIKLTGPITATAQLTTGNAATIDFNGNTLTLANVQYPFVSSKVMVFEDNSPNADGGMLGTGAAIQQMIRVSGGSLTINSGHYALDITSSGAGRTIYGWVPITINGGTISSKNSGTSTATAIQYATTGTKTLTLTVNGGTIQATSNSGEANGIQVNTSTITVLKIPNSGKAVTITAHSAGSNAYGIRNQSTAVLENPKLTVTGTSANATTTKRYVRAVRNERQITITAGSYTGKSLGTGTIYAYGFQNSRVAADDNGSATITGGYYYGEAGNKGFGMNMDYSNLVTVGGTVEVSGSAAAVQPYKGTVNITGGTYKAPTAFSLPEATLTVTGGTYRTLDGSAVVDVTSYLGDGYYQNAEGTVFSDADHPYVTTISGQAPTCVAAGWRDYAQCQYCGTYVDGAVVIGGAEQLEAWKTGAGKLEPTGVHTTEHTAAKEANCTEDGNIEYWYCTVCEQYFTDEACTNAVIESATVVSKKGHSYEDGKCTVCGAEACPDGHTWGDKVEAKTATCAEGGYAAYYQCTVCGSYADENQADTTWAALLTDVDATNHTELVHTEAQAPTVYTAGHEEYWTCSGCRNLYSDAEGTTEIEEPVEIPQLKAVAQIGEVDKFATFQEAVDANVDGGVIVLLDDITLTASVALPYGVARTIDLNGHTIYAGAHTLVNACDLTIQDSSEAGSGKITGTAILITNKTGTDQTVSGNLTIKSGTFETTGTRTVNVETGKLTVMGGTISLTSDGTAVSYAISVASAATADIQGGTISSSVTGSEKAVRTVYVAGTVTIGAATILSHAENQTNGTPAGVYVAAAGNCTLTGTTITATNRGMTGNSNPYGMLVSGKCTVNEGTTITISAESTTKREQAAIMVQETTGNLTINGGTFHSEHNGDSTGYALRNLNASATATVKGGTFTAVGTSTNTAPLYPSHGPIVIYGGDFSGKNVVRTVSAKSTLQIHAGTFTDTDAAETDMSTYFQEDVVASVNSGNVQVAVNTVNEMVTALNTLGANNQAKAKLLQNVTDSGSNTFKYSFELDMDGHTWIQTSGVAVDGQNTAAGTTYIHNGSILSSGTSGAVYIRGGSLHLDGVTIYTAAAMPICYYIANGTEEWNANNLIENSTLITNRFYVFSYRSANVQQNVEMTFKNSDLISLYHLGGGDDIFYNGNNSTTGKYILGEDVDLYVIRKEAVIAYNAGNTPVEGTVHDRLDAASYEDVNAKLAAIGTALGYTDGQTVYHASSDTDNSKDAIWVSAPSLYKWTTNHTYSDATCKTPATCSCAGTTGEVNPENHASTETKYLINATTHQLAHACCDAVIEDAAAHTYANGKCSVCGYGCEHPTTETVSGKAPTCTETGLTEGTKCTVCGEFTVAQQPIPANGHTMEHHEKVDATCTTDGNPEYWYCSVCKKNFADEKGENELTDIVDEATGHNLTPTNQQNAECEKAGHKAYWYCENCKIYFSAEAATAEDVIEDIDTWKAEGGAGYIEPLEHKADDADSWTSDEAGKHYKVCMYCQEYKLEEKCEDHAKTVPGKAATCTEDGLEDGSYCEVCNYVITAQKTIPALGHDFVNGTVTDSFAGNCQTESYVTTKCARCDVTETVKGEKNANVHTNLVKDEAVAATCTTTGLTEGEHCADCGVVTNAQEETPKLGHTEEIIPGKAATCTESGLTEGKKCTVCGVTTVEQETIPATDHAWAEASEANYTAATTEKDGYWTLTCGNGCGETKTVVDEGTRLHVNVPPVKAENISGETGNLTNDQVQEIIDSVVHSNTAVVEKDVFHNSAANDAVIADMKSKDESLKDKEPVLHIELKVMDVKDNKAHKMTFDVTPKLGDVKIELAEAITFYLPVDDHDEGFVTVYHEGVVIPGYEKVAIIVIGSHKYVEVTAKDFSEYTVELYEEPSVVEVATLAELQVALAADNDLPILITQQIEIAAGENVTLDLNGKTVNAVMNGTSTTNHIYAISNKGDLTITDSKGNGSINSRGIYNYGELTLEAGTINAIDGNGGYAVNNESGSTFVMNGGTLAATYEDGDVPGVGTDATALDVPSGCTATLNGGKIVNVPNYTFAIMVGGELIVPEDSTVVVEGVHGAVCVSGGTATIDAGSFSMTGTAATTDSLIYVPSGTVTINGGSFDVSQTLSSSGRIIGAYDSGKATVNGGTFTSNGWFDFADSAVDNVTVNGATCVNCDDTVKAYVAANKSITLNGETYTNVVKEKIAEVDGVQYTDLQEAIDAADGKTVTLLTDVTLTEAITIESGKTVKLDLAGKTVSMEDASGKAACAVMNKGDLTIDDTIGDGMITFVSTTPSATNSYSTSTIINVGNLTVDGGTIKNTTTSGPSYAIDNAWYTQDVSLTVNDGTIKAAKIAVRQVPFSTTYKNVVNVNGGTLSGATAGLQLHNYASSATLAEVNIKGGTLEGTYPFYTYYSSASISAGTKIAIEGGTFDGSYVFLYNGNAGSSEYPMDITVTGGTFNCAYYAYCADAEDNSVDIPSIAGGTFTYPVEETLCKDGFVPTENADGTYGVTEATYVAQIGDTKYTTLQAAFDAAAASQEMTMITLIDDVELTETAVLKDKAQLADGSRNNVVLSTNNYKITGAVAPLIYTENVSLMLFNATLISTAESGAVIENAGALTVPFGTNKIEAVNDGCKAITSTGSLLIEVGDYYGAVEAEGYATIRGGVFYDTVDLADDIQATLGSGITIVGGTYHVKPEEADLADGYVINENADGTYGVTEATYVAEVNGTKYETLAEAIAAAQAGETVTVISDIVLTEAITVANGKTVTIDLNGKTISGTDTTNKSYALITNKGDLTVKDSVGTGKITLTATQDTGYDRYSTVISNTVGGKLTVESGTIEHLGGHTMAYAIDNLTNGKGTYAETVINGGTVKSSYVGIRQFLNGVEADNILTVNGGTVTGNNTSIFFQDPSKNCNSGKLTVGSNATLGNRIYVSGTEGTAWDVEFSVSAQALGTYGITTSEIPATSMIKEENGVYGIIEAVATVDGVGYATLQEAIDAAGEGDTVTLLTDLTVESDLADAAKGLYNIAADDKITIDLNGKTINVTDNSTGNFILFYSYGELTIKNGTINLTATNDRDWNAQSTIILNRGGILTVESGTYTHNGGSDMAFVLDNSGNWYGDATTTVKGGTLTSSYIAIRNRMEQNSHGASGKTTLNVEGGTINGTSRAIWSQAASVSETAPATGAINVSGGEIGLIDTARSTGAVSMTTITGGTVAAFKGEVGELTVKGGTLSAVEILTADGEAADYAVTDDGVYVAAVAKIGTTGYVTLAEALTAAQDGETIELLWAEGDAPIAMNGAVFGKTVTITGTATVDWSKGNLFIGRGGAGNGTVIFDNANLTSASNQASTGIHVSGREKDTTNKYDGTMIMRNSNIELDYLINKGTMNLDNSTLTVKNGFSIGGRPASETESGADATATLNLTNGSKVVVNNHNGMGLGYEAIGVMNVDATSTFETTQSFKVTAKGTLNLAGTATIAGTLENLGSIVLTDKAATLNSTECGNVTTNVEGYKVSYADGAYKLAECNYVAQIGEKKFESVAEAVAYAKTEGITDLVITLIGETTAATTDSFDLVYTTVFNSVTIKQEDATKTYYLLDLYTGARTNGGKLVFDGVNLTVTEQYMFEGNVELINNSKITSTAEANCFVYYANVTVQPGSKLKGVIDDIRGGTLTVDGGRTDGQYNTEADLRDAILVVNWADSELVLKNGAYVMVNSANEVGRVTVNGTVDISASKLDSYQWIAVNSGATMKLDLNSEVVTKQITGAGTITIDASAFTGETQVIKADMSGFTGTVEVTGNDMLTYEVKADGLYVVEKALFQNTTTGATYTDLQTAINEAAAGETIQVLENVELTDTVTVAAGKTVTLDLNGKTISQTKECTASYDMIANNGSLTICDSATGGKISFTDTSAGDAAAKWGVYTIRNSGTLVVESGTIENLSAQNQAGQPFAHTTLAIFQYSGSTTINGGVISTPNYRSVRLWSGDLTINGGVLDGQVWVQCVNDTAKLTITGGEFSPNWNDASSVFVNNSGKAAELNITGGNFATKIGADSPATLNGLKIAGGTFTAAAAQKTNEALLGNGFAFAENADGSYGITAVLPEVEITDIKVSLADSDPDQTFALNFKIKDLANLSDEYLEALFNVYGSYYVDYVLTIEGLSDADVTFNANGGADGYLAGQYDAWSKNWVSVPFKDVTMANGESLYIMEYAAELMGKQGLRFTLAEVAEIVQDFDCGVYFTPEFLKANPNLKVTLELKVFTEDAEGNKIEDMSVATNVFENEYEAIVVSPNKQTHYFTTLEEAVAAAEAGETVMLLADATIDETIKIEKAITVDLFGNAVTTTAKKAFEVYADATIMNGTIEAANRAVDTRTAVALTLTDVNLIADEYTAAYGNPQPLTIGGSTNGTKVTMNNVTIDAGTAGYGIITFVETELTATDSTIGGYSALYVKPGSENSKFTFVNTDLSGSTANNDVEGNSFTTIAVRADNVTVTADADSTITATGNHCAAISLGGTAAGEEEVNGAIVTVAGTINGNVLAKAALNDNKVTVPAVYGDKLVAAGYSYFSNADGSITATEKVDLPEVEITDIKASLPDSDPDLTFALNFKIKDLANLSDEYLEALFNVYGSYYVDYVLTIEGLSDADVTFNANGGADGYLAGQYDAWSKNWVSVPFEDVTMANGESLYIMEYAAELMGKQGLRFTLAEVAEIVQDFDCGVYFTPEFLKANPNLKVTLELKVFTEDAEGNKIEDMSVATNVFENEYEAIVVATNKQTHYFTTLEEAVAAAEAGETVILLADAECDSIVVIDKAITLDGFGNTLKSTATRAINVACDGAVEIKDLTIDCGANTERAVNVIEKPATVTLTNVTVPYAKYAVNVATSAGAATVNIVDSDITGYAALNITADGVTANVTNSTLTGKGIEGETNDFATIDVQANDVTVTTTGGKIAATGTQQWLIGVNDGYSGATFVLDSELDYADAGIVGAELEGNAISVREAYVNQITAEGFMHETSAIAGLIDLTHKAVASVNGTLYDDLRDAIDDAEELGTATVIVLDNIELKSHIVVSDGITLDLNGYAVTTTKTFTVYGDVIDGTAGGEGYISASKVHIAGERSYLPIYDTAVGGYRFYDYQLINLGARSAGENAVKFGIRLVLTNTDGYAVLANTTDAKLSLHALVTWESLGTDIDYVFQTATVKSYAEQVAAQVASGATITKAITLTVTGLDKLPEGDTLKLTPQLESETEMTTTGATAEWATANS